MLLRPTEDFVPSTPLPSPELERLRADVALASASVALGADRLGGVRSARAVSEEGSVRRSRRRRLAFDLDPRLRAADLRAQERLIARSTSR